MSAREHGRHREEESAVQEETDDEKKKLLQIIERDGEEEDEEVNCGCCVGNERKLNCFPEMSFRTAWMTRMAGHVPTEVGLFLQHKDSFLKGGSGRGESKDFICFR